MKRRRFLKTALVPAASLSVGPLLRGITLEQATVASGELKAILDADGMPTRIESGSGTARRMWMTSPAFVSVCNEASQVSASPHGGLISALGLSCTSRWSSTPHGLAWDLQFDGTGKRAGHEVTIDLPVLASGLKIFTPSNNPEADVSAQPTHRPVPYGIMGWTPGVAYVLPLVTVLDPATDRALTVALPPDVNIPHLQVEWIAGRTLRLTLAHRGMGGGKPSPLRILFYSHAADYRCALKAYSDQFPEYFEPPLPRGSAEGRVLVSPHSGSSGFRGNGAAARALHVVEFLVHLPRRLHARRPRWAPFTYGHHWKLGQMMSDEKIKAFVAEMKAHGIGVYGYFNVTEFGGVGAAADDSTAIPTHLLQTRFADALLKDAQGRAVPSWEGSSDMNPRLDGSFWPWLKMQCERYFQRLPELAGLIIDRLDWASRFDYGHDDGFSMIGNQSVENMAMPVAAAVREVCASLTPLAVASS